MLKTYRSIPLQSRAVYKSFISISTNVVAGEALKELKKRFWGE